MNDRYAKGVPVSGAGRGLPHEFMPSGAARLAWLPIPLLVVAIIAGRVAGLHGIYQNEALRLVLSFVFYTMVSLGTLFLIGRSFLKSGSPGLLLLEGGVVLWSLAGTVGDLFDRGDANINVTIFNTGILLAGLFHLAGAIFSLRPQRALRPSPLWLGVGCALALGSLGLITWAALEHWLPVFFIPGHGGTLVRHGVLSAAIAMFVLSAILLLAGRRGANVPFIYWYSLALLLLAVGLFGIMIQLSLWSVVNWLGRMGQWLGGFYLFLAAVVALRESDLPLLPLEEKARPALYRDAMAMVIVLAAAAVRLAFLSSLGTHAPYVVFFPAVMFAAIYGGWRSGLLATVLSAIFASYFWVGPAGRFAVEHPAGWVGLIIFLLGGCMIAWIAESMHRAIARASAAETQALLAAEREAAAEVLRKSEERYHTLFTGMNEGFAIHELLMDEFGHPVDYRFLDVNPVFERLTGLDRREVVGKTHKDVLPGDDAMLLQLYSQVALTGQPVQFENYAPTLKRHYEVFAYRPAPMQFAVIFMDITERKQAEEKMREARAAAINLMEDAVEARQQTEEINEKLQQEIAERKQAEQALRESRERLDLALISSRMASFDWDIIHNKRIWSDGVHDLLGTRPETFTGTAEEFFRIMPPEDRIVVQSALARAVEITGLYETEYRAIWPDGSIHHMAARGKVHRDDAGRAVQMTGVCWDITERKRAEEALRESEEKYRNLFANMAEEVHFWRVVRDEAGQIETWRLVDANPPTLKSWGRPSIEEIRGKTTDEIFGPGAREHYLPVVHKIMTEGVSYTYEDFFPNLDKYFRFTSVPLGEYFITTGADITGIKKAELALREADRRKEVLLKEIHHRVKNNMQVISSLVSLQADGLRDPAVREVLRDMSDRVRSMALVHEKLYQSADLARVDFAEYSRSLLSYLWRAHGTAASGVKLTLDLEPAALPVDVAVPCGLILNELVGNALKHAFRGRSEGEVTVALREGADGQVRMCVSDNGVGMPADLDWRRAHTLGLRLVQILTDQLDSTVEIRVNNGTEFEIGFKPSGR